MQKYNIITTIVLAIFFASIQSLSSEESKAHIFSDWGFENENFNGDPGPTINITANNVAGNFIELKLVRQCFLDSQPLAAIMNTYGSDWDEILGYILVNTNGIEFVFSRSNTVRNGGRYLLENDEDAFRNALLMGNPIEAIVSVDDLDYSIKSENKDINIFKVFETKSCDDFWDMEKLK